MRTGRLLGSDLPGPNGTAMRSPRFRLAGRPDEIRELPDGSWVPVEVKSRPAPRHGPPFSHRVQLAAYLLLIEESTGRRPSYGVLRYGDGTEFRVEWTAALRDELLEVRRALTAPYDGRETPSAGRCAGCAWRLSCDRAAL